MRRGGAVLSARVEEAEAARRAEYWAEGWSRSDPAATAYAAPEVQAERERRVRVYRALAHGRKRGRFPGGMD